MFSDDGESMTSPPTMRHEPSDSGVGQWRDMIGGQGYVVWRPLELLYWLMSIGHHHHISRRTSRHKPPFASVGSALHPLRNCSPNQIIRPSCVGATFFIWELFGPQRPSFSVLHGAHCHYELMRLATSMILNYWVFYVSHPKYSSISMGKGHEQFHPM